MTGMPPDVAAGVTSAGINQAGERRSARVESLRALAAIGVVTGHAWGFAHGYGTSAQSSFLARIVFGGGFGVFLFFALSGYLLFWPFARHYFGGGDSLDLGRYALNRALRIMPLYWTAVVVLLLVQEHGGTGEQWWRFMLLAENFSHRTIGTVDGVLWSLVVEVHFYILLPFLAAALARITRRRRTWAALVLGLLGSLSLAAWELKVQGSGDPLWRYNIPATFFYFVPGMLLALLRLSWSEQRPGWVTGLVASSDAWLLVSILICFVTFWRYDLVPLAAVASFFAVGGAVLPLRAGRLRAVLDCRPLAAIGVASYSLYVWHFRIQARLDAWPRFPHSSVAMIAITVPLSIAVAFVSYRLIEEPFLRLRRRWSPASAPIRSAAEPRRPQLDGRAVEPRLMGVRGDE